MLQIAIWGMSLMLLVKGLDVLHRQRVAVSAASDGTIALSWAILAVTVLGAIFLFVAAERQVGSGSYPSPNSPTLGLSDQQLKQADEMANEAVAEAERAMNDTAQYVDNAAK